VLIVGLAYKKNVPDIRESPSLKLIELIEARGGLTDYHDPHVAAIPPTREHRSLEGRRSIDWTEETIRGFDAVLIATDHDAIDYTALAGWSPLIVDTRNAFGRRQIAGDNIVKA
jgi:UDP-N-acetyl-D-glucosamine dehydrogenase